MVTAPLAPPDRTRCPACGARLGGSRCGACGAELSGPVGIALWDVEDRLYRLAVRRTELVGRLRADASALAPATAAPPAPGLLDHRPPPPVAGFPGWATATPAPAPGGAHDDRSAGPEVSSILLGLGVTLLVLAALVFAAVSWNRIGPLGQGALLVGLTAAVALGTDRAVRRGLTGTAEALGVLTVVLGPLVAQAVRLTVDLPRINDRTWANWSSWSWWPAAIVVIGAAAVGFGRAVGVRSPRYLGVVLVQVGLPVWVALAPVPPTAIALVLLAQATLVGTGPAFRDRDPVLRPIWAGGAALTWATAMLTALAWAVAEGGRGADRIVAVALLAAGAGSAGVVSWRARDRADLSGATALAAAVTGHLAVARGLVGAVDDGAVWAAGGAVAAGGLAVADRLRGPSGTAAAARSGAVAAVSVVASAVAALPVLLLGSAAASAALSGAPWRSVASHPVEVDTWSVLDPAWAVMLAGLLALALAVVASHQWIGRRAAVVGVTALAVVGASTVPVLAGATVGVVCGLALVVAAVAGLAGRERRSPAMALLSLGALALGVVWAAPNPGLLLVALVLGVGLGVAGAVQGTAADDAARAAIGAALASTSLVVGTGVAVHGVVVGPWGAGSSPWVGAAVSIVAAVAVGALPLLATVPVAAAARRRLDEGEPTGAGAVDVVGPVAAAVLAGAHALGLVVAASADGGGAAALATPITVSLAVGAAASGVGAALTARRRPGWWGWAAAAGGEALVLTWYRLAIADVATVEAYTVPAAAVVGIVAWLAARGRPGGVAGARSWELEGTALALLLVPTALAAVADPGIVRQAVGLVAGAALLAAGAAWRRRAPIDVGAAIVGVLGLQVVAPYAAEIPRWISLGTVGAVLVALGATFEERRRDLHQARRRYGALR